MSQMNHPNKLASKFEESSLSTPHHPGLLRHDQEPFSFKPPAVVLSHGPVRAIIGCQALYQSCQAGPDTTRLGH